MSGSDVHQAHYVPEAGQHHSHHQSSSSNECFYDASNDDAPFMTPLTSPTRPLGPLRSATLNLPGSFESDGSSPKSPDPHEYYRQHKPPVPGEHSSPPPYQRVASLPSYNAFSSPSRSHTDPQNRSVSDTTRAAAATGRARQISFKDLINKFDKSNDQVLPNPSRTQVLASPPSSPASTSRPQLVTQTSTESSRGPNSPTGPVAPVGPAGHTGARLVANLGNAFASGSGSGSVSSPRRPLRFGERLSVDTNGEGLALPALNNRRGSEGSIPSPGGSTSTTSAAIHLDRPSTGPSPLTPTAWYLGKTPYLEAVESSSANASRSSTNTNTEHRRSRSDIPKSSHLEGALTPLRQDEQPLPQPSRRPSTPTISGRQHSRSRIPISSRHLNSASGTDVSPKTSSATTFRSRSAAAAAQVSLPPIGASRLPRPSFSSDSHPGTTDDESPQPYTRGSGRARDRSAMGRVRQQQLQQQQQQQQQLPGRNAKLQAYIGSSAPQKSTPPLRSSRPRKPVSSNTANSTNPQSRVGEKVSGLQQRQLSRDPRGSRRERRLPELGHVDFATRRQQIQQAFNRTVKENERKEEEAAAAAAAEEENKRQLQAREDDNNRVTSQPIPTEQQQQQQLVGHQEQQEEEQQHTIDKVASSSPVDDTATVIDDQGETCDEEQQQSPASRNDNDTPSTTVDRSSESSLPTPQLRLQTDIPAQQKRPGASADHQAATMDSPTLGVPGNVTNNDPSIPASPAPPTSAATACSTDTHVTALDPEPQSGIDGPKEEATSHQQQSLLSHIMQARESSPSSSSCDETEYNSCDNDDPDYIPVMFGVNGGVGTVKRKTNNNDDNNNNNIDNNNNNSSSSGGANGNPEQESCDESPQDLHTATELLPNNRWSASSWSSSFQDQQYDDCSGEDLSHITASAADDSEAATQSCSASSSTPPSVSGQQFSITSPPQADSEKVDSKNEDSSSSRSSSSALNRVSAGLSNPASIARLGGWDSKRITQLYFEELARGRGANLSSLAGQLSPESTSQRPDSLTDDPVVVPGLGETPALNQPRNSSSLIFRDDWEHASPSIADWMQVAAHDDSAAESDKNEPGARRDHVSTPRLDPSKTHVAGDSKDQNALGLAINVHAPMMQGQEQVEPSPSMETPRPTTSKQPPPPKPTHAPPAIPVQNEQSSSSSSSQQQQQQQQHATQASSSSSARPLALVNSTSSSDSSSLRRLETIPSPHGPAIASSVTSLAPSQPEGSSYDLRRGSPSPEQRRLKKRRHVIKELVDTEYNFGRDMKVVDDIYKGTSSSCLDLSTDDVKILFGNSDQVVQFSMAFQDALKNAAKSIYVMPKSQRWSSKRTRNRQLNASQEDQASIAGMEAFEIEKDRATFIGQVFLVYAAQMEKVYSDYLKNHDAANKKLQVLQRNPKVAIWLKECRDWASDLTTAWDLDSLLVKPVQRILKYPLLLTELLDSTSPDHPDHAPLLSALEEVTNISVRINEMKKRADLVGQAVGRKRNQSDVRAGLSKAFGRRTEKFRQNVGVADLFEDKVYDEVSQLFGDRYVQVQLVMRDVETYIHAVQGFVNQLNEFILGIEAFIDVAQSNYSELELKWRQFKISTHDIVATALPDHVAAVRKHVTDRMITLLKLYEEPQRVMRKRDKRLMDYARSKTAKDRGEKVDKKTMEQAEQFMALNETLKDELPKLYGLTAKFMDACLKNYVQVVTPWLESLQQRLMPFADTFPDDYEKIYGEWASDFTFSDAQVMSLGICNGSMLADMITNETPSGRPSTVNSNSTRVASHLEESPKISNDSKSGSGGYQFQSPAMDSQSFASSAGRRRADSTVSRPGAGARSVSEISPEMFSSPMLQRVTTSSTTNASSSVAPLSGHPSSEPFPSLPELNIHSPLLGDVMSASSKNKNNNHGNGNAVQSTTSPNTSGGRYSGFFSSAMPMSDNPEDAGARPNANSHSSESLAPPTVLFLAASIYEFNIDRARREAGYPYLTYVVGEIFDVIGEKGELWLAQNQDDPTHQVGWIWNKHFAKLSG